MCRRVGYQTEESGEHSVTNIYERNYMELPSVGGQIRKNKKPTPLSFYSECDKKDYPVTLMITTYLNGNLAILLQTKDKGGPDNYATITVNFPDELLPPDQAYLDTNNVPEIEQFIKDNKLGKPKHRHHISGFCAYPLYELDLPRCLEYGVLAEPK